MTKLLQNRRFDLAMVAFLDCLKEVIEHVAASSNRTGGAARVPHLSVAPFTLNDLSLSGNSQREQGQDWRRLDQAAIRNGGDLDASSSPCASPARCWICGC